MFINQRVFDPELVGCAVHIGGRDINSMKFDRTYLVKAAKGETLTLVDFQGDIVYTHIESFGIKNPLQMIILERPNLFSGSDVKPVEDVEINHKRRFRSIEQIEMEVATVEKYLKDKKIPMRLERIISTMQRVGSTNWNNKNASGFVQQAIKHGAKIRKVKRGVYVYDEGVTIL